MIRPIARVLYLNSSVIGCLNLSGWFTPDTRGRSGANHRGIKVGSDAPMGYRNEDESLQNETRAAGNSPLQAGIRECHR